MARKKKEDAATAEQTEEVIKDKTRIRVLVSRIIRLFELPEGYPGRDGSVPSYQKAIESEGYGYPRSLEEARQLSQEVA